MARENRSIGDGPAQILAGSSNTSSVPATPDALPAPLIGHTVEKSLDAALSRLQSDEISLDDLTPALVKWYLTGHGAGLASTLPELTRVELERDQAVADRDRYYAAAFNPRAPIKIGPSYAELEKRRHEFAGVTA